MQLAVYLPMPGIKAIIPGHFKILLWDMLDQEFDEVRQCFADKRISLHGTTVGRIPTVDYLFDVFHDNRSWFKVIFNDLIFSED